MWHLPTLEQTVSRGIRLIKDNPSPYSEEIVWRDSELYFLIQEHFRQPEIAISELTKSNLR